MGLPALTDPFPTNPINPSLHELAGSKRWSRRRRQTEAARKAILWGLGLVIFSQVALGLLLKIQFPHLRDLEYSARVERIQHRTGPAAGNPFTVLILGSSRSELGIRARHIEELLSAKLNRPVVAMNFAVSAGGPLTSLFTWHRLQLDHFRPDLVLLEAHPTLLGDHVDAGEELRELLWPVSRFRWNELTFVEQHARAARPNVKFEWMKTEAVPLFGFRKQLIAVLAPKLLPNGNGNSDPTHDMDESGQHPGPEFDNSAEQAARALAVARKEYYRNLQRLHLGGSEYAAWLELMETLRQEKVPTAVVLMPEGPEFRSWYPGNVWQEAHKKLVETAKEFDMPFLDAHDWMSEEDFFDSHHLTRAAALRFTDRLTTEKVIPIATKLSPTDTRQVASTD